jgi:hypothetical protein
MSKTIWGAHPLPEEEPVCWQLGPLHLWFKSTLDELWVNYKHSPIEAAANTDDDSQETVEFNELDWRRWTLKQSYKEIQLTPRFPNLPVVVKPEYPFRVTKGVRTKIYVRVPLWVSIYLEKTAIVEIPTVVLSKTWFGSFTDGELCYWISSAARKRIEPDLTRAFLAICPIQIINRSEDELLVEKICLRVNQLALYTLKHQLWGNETRVNYRGKNERSEIEFLHKAPPDVPKAKQIAPPRDSATKSFTAKTFASLMELPGLGFLHNKEK